MDYVINDTSMTYASYIYRCSDFSFSFHISGSITYWTFFES